MSSVALPTVSLSEKQVLAFNAITNFIKALASEFGGVQKSLALYGRLIEHMTLSHVVPITRVVESFTKYVSVNSAAIETSSETALKEEPIYYNSNSPDTQIFIDLKAILKLSDNITKETIWKHLLTIYGILFPESQARELIKKLNTEKRGGNRELISDMFGKLMPIISSGDVSTENPMSAIMGLLASGAFTDMIGMMNAKISSGEVNPNTLLGDIGTMFSQVDPTAKALPAISGTEEKKA